MLAHLYPEQQWLPWKFSTVHKSLWEDKDMVNKYINWLSQKLNIKLMDDWYRVSLQVSKLFFNIRKQILI